MPPANPDPPTPPRGGTPLGWAVAGAAVGVVLAVAAQALNIFMAGNFHEVLPGQVYRSAQLPPDELESLLRRRGVRTVVNLRGCAPGFDWYDAECRVTHRCGVAQEDVCLSSGRLPSAAEVRRLVDVIDRSARPILFHCHRGIDRTGLASAMALLMDTAATPARARGQLGLRYGHLVIGKTGYLDRFFDLYEGWLRERGLRHSPDVFRSWARDEYRPAECWARLEFVDAPPPLAPGRPAVLRVRATNVSGKPWRLRPSRVCGVHLRFVVYDCAGGILAKGYAGMFDASVAPGESIELTLAIPPLPAGRHLLMADMEDSGHCLFAQAGSEPLEEELTVGE